MTSTATPPDTAPRPDGDTAAHQQRDDAPAPGVAHLAAAPRRGVRRFWWWLAGITAAALAVRLTYLMGWRTPWPVIGDPYYYHQGANLLADGEGYVHPYQYLLFGVRMPGADHPPGYMTVLSGFSWLGLRYILCAAYSARVNSGVNSSLIFRADAEVAEPVGSVVGPDLFFARYFVGVFA